MNTSILSGTELQVAETYCHEMRDKEVALELNKPEWTVKTHKKNIYRRLGIGTTTGIVLYILCLKFDIRFDLKRIRTDGIDYLVDEIKKKAKEDMKKDLISGTLVMAMLISSVTFYSNTFGRASARTNISRTYRTYRSRNDNDYFFT